MAESEMLRNIRLMKEKREQKLKFSGMDPIAEIEKCSMLKRKAIIDTNYQQTSDIKLTHSDPENSVLKTQNMDEFEPSSEPENATPKTQRKSKWKEMAKERQLWDTDPVVKYTTDPPAMPGEPISATGLVRPKFEVLSAKQQVERALLRSGKPDAKE